MEELKKNNLYRKLKTIEEVDGVRVKIGGKWFVNFSSNDYLNLAFDKTVANEHIKCLKNWGTGAGASRLITGNFQIHEVLEKELAKLKKTEAALLFSTGYMANIGILSSIMGKDDVIFSDKLNHASIIDGCKLSKAKIFVYEHNNTENLKTLLERERKRFKSACIVTDSVFSMDGDIAPLDELFELSLKYDTYFVVDDAHATGVIGYSSFEIFNITPAENTVIMGTLGKALGTFGAFVASTETLRKFFINKARSFIFTTALPPHIACATLYNLKLIPERMEKLKKNIELFQKLTGFKSKTAIFPVVVGDSQKALDISEKLFKSGFIIPAIRPPTVPEKTSRLRITLSAGHTEEDIINLTDTLNKLI
ncbi:8-amino-7-oxononanoate synthase [Desulfurobacterium atlanticum]|uniref:8-amino-7-oxononanoate synthase n=1 Tax=Desulfurobacterium atlanticum TaxID=240169 RepID=UPI001FEA84F9|nr:8-amino-7-oxononanoate synthase [Desulfurobacterium atlanticum]